MIKKFVGLCLASLLVFSGIFSFTGSAQAETSDNVKADLTTENINVFEKNIATFDLNSPVKQEKEVVLKSGKTATLGIEPVNDPRLRVSNGSYKIYLYAGTVNVDFHINVSGNKITRAYDPWYFIVGASVKSNELKLDNSKQATYYFSFGTPIWDFGGWNGWLRAKINSSNQLVTSYS